MLDQFTIVVVVTCLLTIPPDDYEHTTIGGVAEFGAKAVSKGDTEHDAPALTTHCIGFLQHMLADKRPHGYFKTLHHHWRVGFLLIVQRSWRRQGAPNRFHPLHIGLPAYLVGLGYEHPPHNTIW